MQRKQAWKNRDPPARFKFILKLALQLISLGSSDVARKIAFSRL